MNHKVTSSMMVTEYNMGVIDVDIMDVNNREDIPVTVSDESTLQERLRDVYDVVNTQYATC